MYKVSVEPNYLRAELLDRETVEETQEFLRAVLRDSEKHRRPSILILVRTSKPVFQVASHRLIEYIEELSGKPARRIALVGDTRDLHMSHEYIEFLARQRGLNVRSFRSETSALQWFKDQRQREERRQRQERRNGERRNGERRNGDRRGGRESGGAGSAIPESAR